MGGFFGVVSKGDCSLDLFYGTDYHSHLGTCRGGLAVLGEGGFVRNIHDISNTQFRTKFEADIAGMLGVRRATVSEVGAELEDKGLIRRGRGWVEVTDRKALEGAACGCYGAMRGLMKDLGVPHPDGDTTKIRFRRACRAIYEVDRYGERVTA